MAKFSPTFSIDITDNFAVDDDCTVTNPGQAFEIIDVIASGSAGGVVTIKKNTSGGNTAAVATLISAGSSVQVTDANSSFASTDNIWVGVATAAVTRVTIICRATTTTAATWTNTTPA
jgi:hypothetical protein